MIEYTQNTRVCQECAELFEYREPRQRELRFRQLSYERQRKSKILTWHHRGMAENLRSGEDSK